MTTITPSFQAGGLASGLDTNGIIDGLVKVAQQPIDQLRTRQTGLRSQVSLMGDIASKLAALGDAARGLATDGVLGTRVASATTSFAAATARGATAGAYAVSVEQTAAAAKALSSAFGPGESVTGGSLELSVDGQPYTTPAWDDGASLQQVAEAIRASGAPVSAVVLDDGVSQWLSVTKRDTGRPLELEPGADLVIAESATGSSGHPLGLEPTQVSANAELTIDGVAMTRRSNTVADAIPGVTLTLQAAGGAERLVVQDDVDATQKRLQGYVDAYNAVIRTLQQQLSPTKDTDRSATLAGDTTVRTLQRQLQGIGSTLVPDLGGLGSLADLGVKTSRDGTLSIDPSTLAAAVGRAPDAVDALFSSASTGLSAVVGGLVQQYVEPGSGVLVLAESGLQDQIAQLDDQAQRLQDRADAYRASLVAQFAAMEEVVSQMKSVGSFLAAQASSSQQGK